jgi:hypothetical protein
MPHMFKIEFITNQVDGLTKGGKVLVVAESHEQAFELVCAHLKLPISRTRVLDSFKIKPPCYSIEVHEHHLNAKASVRHAGVARTNVSSSQRYTLTVHASVHGQSEQQIMRKVGEELQARGANMQTKHNLIMEVDCAPANRGGTR